MLVQRQVGIPLAPALGWYIGNTSEALIGAAAINYLSRIGRIHFSFEGTGGLAVFLTGAVFIAPVLTSFVDAASTTWSGYGRGYWTLWSTRLVSNVIANLTLVPTIVTTWRGGFSWLRKASFLRQLELAAVLVGASVVSFYVFSVPSGPLTNISASIFAPLPFLLWASLRFGVGGVTSALLMVALISLCSAVHGMQTSATAAIARNVLTLQVFIAAFGVTLVWLPALISERQRMEFSATRRREFLIETEQALREAGRKLHGGLVQELTLLGLHAEDLSGQAEPATLLKAELLMLNHEIAQLSKAARDWSHTLDPVRIDYLGLEGALAALCRRASMNSPVRFDFNAEIGPGHLDSLTSLCLYRVVQGMIETIVKLRSAHKATVKLEVSANTARLIVEHDGTAITGETPQESDPGIISARERITLLNGTFSVQCSPAGGRIDVAVPLTEIKQAN
jgi:signal transduction histidine kinase